MFGFWSYTLIAMAWAAWRQCHGVVSWTGSNGACNWNVREGFLTIHLLVSRKRRGLSLICRDKLSQITNITVAIQYSIRSMAVASEQSDGIYEVPIRFDVGNCSLSCTSQNHHFSNHGCNEWTIRSNLWSPHQFWCWPCSLSCAN